MNLSELDYDLPEELIATHPPAERDQSRLLVVQRGNEEGDEKLLDRVFHSLPALLSAGDLLILNDTRVIPALFYLSRSTGGRIEGLFVEEQSPGRWQVLLKSAGRCARSESLAFEGDRTHRATLVESLGREGWIIDVSPPAPSNELLTQIGQTPLPPYVRKARRAENGRGATQAQMGRPVAAGADADRYQTVYARQQGSVAAPTAGLHFTHELLQQIQDRGVGVEYVTLHVGLGTFQPIEAQRLADHAMHAERYSVPERTAAAIAGARERSARVIAVGTTTVRVLESAAADERGRVIPGEGMTRLFIYPPYDFKVVDAMVTNFHLPYSTLLAMVMAFAGVETLRRAYRHAIEAQYRFYSFGDAMFLER